MLNLGDYKKGTPVIMPFTTVNGSGAPTVLTSGTVVIYKNSSTTPETGAETLSIDFHTIVGLNHVSIDTSGSFFTRRSDYWAVITVGTVDGVSVVGYIPGYFSIENRYVAGLLARGTVVSATASTVVLEAFSFADNLARGSWVNIVGGTGASQSRYVTLNDESSDELTVSPSWDTTPDNTSEYEWLQSPPGVSSPLPEVDANVTYRKNVAITGFGFWMLDNDGNPVTGITPVGTWIIDGVEGPLINAITEVGTSGAYKVDITAAEMNGNEILFKFTGTGARTVAGKIATQP